MPGGRRILVVEDERIVAFDLKKRLERLGHTVLGLVGTGVEAVEQAAESKPDLVLMDIKLRGKMDGIQAAELIRSRAEDVRIVYLTAFTDAATLERALRTQPSGFLNKPFRDIELKSTLDLALLDLNDNPEP